MDGLFVYHLLRHEQLDYEDYRALIELLVEHEAVQRLFDRKTDDVRRDWCRTRLRELRDANPQAAWEDAEAEWDRAHPYEPSRMEQALGRRVLTRGDGGGDQSQRNDDGTSYLQHPLNLIHEDGAAKRKAPSKITGPEGAQEQSRPRQIVLAQGLQGD